MISIVIPACDEEGSIPQLVKEIDAVCSANGIEYEVVFIDDGSIDNTWAVINDLANRNSRVKGLSFAQNFGKACALDTGFRCAQGRFVIQMDADLQDDPAEIPNFLRELNNGYDLVCGYKKHRHDPLNRVLGSRIYNRVVSKVFGIKLHDHNCGYKAYRKSVLTGLNLYGEMHRFIPALLARKRVRIKEIVIQHRPRRFGESKYGASRVVRAFLDMLTVLFIISFRQRPLHFLGGLGLVSFFTGFCGLAYLAFIWTAGHNIGHRPLLIYSAAALILGFQLFATGILAELFTYYLVRPNNSYQVTQNTKPIAAYQGKIMGATKNPVSTIRGGKPEMGNVDSLDVDQLFDIAATTPTFNRALV